MRLGSSVFPVFLTCFGVGPAVCQQTLDLNSVLMQATFKIEGPKKGNPGKTAFGTVFVVSKPKPLPARGASRVLVTAAHVLDDIAGDTAQIIVRQKLPDGSVVPRGWPIAIRKDGMDLFRKHGDYSSDRPEADVAALNVELPNVEVGFVPAVLFANDARLEEYGVHPGDQAFCLGFPLNYYPPSGFPTLRGGAIASYPLTPTTVYRSFLLDLRVFDGNSGGPVYFVERDRFYKGQAGHATQFILGLVRGTQHADNGKALSLAVVVPARYIIETLALLSQDSPRR